MGAARPEALCVGPSLGQPPRKGALPCLQHQRSQGSCTGISVLSISVPGGPPPTELGVTARRCWHFEATCASGTGLAIPAASVSVSPPLEG